MGEDNERHVVAYGAGYVVALHKAECHSSAEQVFETLQDVKIGREVSPFGQHNSPWRLMEECSGGELEEIDRGRVRGDDFVSPGPNQWRDLCADALRQV